ncbi:MAG TPA: photosystem reaction center subunit H [Cyanobacteria bacterium UBA8553]|nr:photosystem reaction center subunit H [Cyanobacteria bacterium UBA8553]
MPLFKIGDFNPNYREDAFDGGDVKGLDVYAGRTNEKIGSIHDVLVDQTGRFRYFVIDTGFWIFGKKVLLPIGRCRVDVDGQRINAVGISSKEQAQQLPEYDDRMTVDYDYEERVRRIYRTPAASVPVEMSPPVEASGVVGSTSPAAMPLPVSHQPSPATYDRHTYSYEQEPLLYQMNDQEHQKLRLYEERIVANKSRQQTGEVAIGKRVETETARVSVPVEKERVVIERRTPEDIGTTVNPGVHDFREGEVAHMKVYEETADIRKQAFVREEVNVRKEVERDTIDATETLRREELEVDVNGQPVVEAPNRLAQ